MREAIGQMLPMAVSAAISPLPSIAVVPMLVTPRGRANGLGLVAGRVVGPAVAGALVRSIGSGAGASDDGEPATWMSVLELAVGELALLAGVKQVRDRPRGDAISGF